MEKQNQNPNEQNEHKKHYEPPKAEFVPLRIEERLFGSGTDYFKLLTSCQPPPDSGTGCNMCAIRG